jgi:glycerol-3-phosphate dehydrogenase
MAALHRASSRICAADRGDVLATYAGVRPVIDSGKADPSKEGREHAVWIDDGLLTVAGGKLTTFRVIALDALRLASRCCRAGTTTLEPRRSSRPRRWPGMRLRGTPSAERIEGRYGACHRRADGRGAPGELELIPGTQTFWAELRWAARAEAVLHLDDLLLRRTRLGLQLRGGGDALLPRIRAICQPELGWSDARWAEKTSRISGIMEAHYSLPT